ncbi:zinc finger and SCAN domain-containing protein 12 [Drosophila gunungcola]|uniref:zinc finger and SCAN domain-containing protein 12 n=1 Tax=Drosophila gunungcola TaxID=103775 RepID=UPI0022E4E6C4|nr:zinc finger and SCAN domain-containing protein 12 [Drosophila gunungcola]
MNITSSPKVLMKCRICLGDSEEQTMSSLFDDEAENDDLLIEKVEFCCGIKVRQSAKMPTKACHSCTEFVQMWCNFRQMCLNSQVYWETSFPDSERPEDLLQASDGEYMEYLYEKLQLNSGLENNYQEEISQTTEEEQQLEDNVQEVLDVNGYIIDEQIEEENETVKESPEQILISHLDAYVSNPEMEETIEDKLVEDSSLLNEEYYEVDYEELHEDDFLSTSPSPDPSPKEDPRNSGRFRKLGRPRKPDSELKFKRKEISAQGKATKSKIEDKLVCNLCGNVFYKKSMFTAHLMTHTEYKPHQCEICNKAFRQMGELRAHIRRHTGVRPYKCMYCDRHFYDRSERVRHERVHTNTRPYACQECGKTFTHTAILKNHLLVHSGEKNYSCDICSKSFTLLHQLKAHLQTLTHRNKLESSIPNSTDFTQS